MWRGLWLIVEENDWNLFRMPAKRDLLRQPDIMEPKLDFNKVCDPPNVWFSNCDMIMYSYPSLVDRRPYRHTLLE